MPAKFIRQRAVWKLLAAGFGLIPVLTQTVRGDQSFSVTGLPPLRIESGPAKAHTQGLEIVGGQVYVTARREDLQPKRALLLRTAFGRKEWDTWDITPMNPEGLSVLDHPGGMQSDGEHLWIPLSESKRNGHSLIRRYSISELIPGQAAVPGFEFGVSDHIGAVAVSKEDGIILGASWDTATVYVWDFNGRLKRTLAPGELAARRLGVSAGGTNSRAGLAVQDWKFVGGELFASGLFRGPGMDPDSSQSQFVRYRSFLEPTFERHATPLSKQGRTELAHEGMGVFEGIAYFLPEDLGPTNRLFRARLSGLSKEPAHAP